MTRRCKVVVTDYLSDDDVERPILSQLADLILLQANHDNLVADQHPDADALIVFHDIHISAQSLGKLSRCRGAVRVGVGYDNIDLRAAGQAGIAVCNVPDYGTEDVADHAIMMLLAIARRLILAHQQVRSGVWNPAAIRGAPRLRGKTLGIIGCGRIGTATALRAKGFGLRVQIYDPYQPPGLEKAIGVERHDRLENLLETADFISLHCPLTQETRHLINALSLQHCKPTAFLINTARGGCVDLSALLDALDQGQLAGAALDVVEREPLDIEALRQHPAVILTPHVAYYSVEGFVEMRRKAAEEVRRLLLGEPVRNLVNGPWVVQPRFVGPRVFQPSA